MRNICRCGNPFNNANLGNWIFPSREEGNRKFAKCRRCDLESEVFSEPHEEGAPQRDWIDPDISSGSSKE